MTTPQVAFIIGGGPRIGHAVAKKFLSRGYQVAIGRRHAEKSADLVGVTAITVDVAKPDSVDTAFKEVEAKLGLPAVVVYNAANLTFPHEENDPFSVSPAAFVNDTSVNLTGGYAALHHATRGWKMLRASGTDAKPVFIATGNVTPFYPLPFAVSLSTGKSALVHLIEIAVNSYENIGAKFFFASQVLEDGNTVPYPDVKGEAHAEAYWKISQREIGKNTWDVRFSVGEDGVLMYKKE